MALFGSINFYYFNDEKDSGGGDKTGSDRYGGGLYLGLERHFGTSRLTPYAGGAIGAGYSNQINNTESADNEISNETEKASTYASVQGKLGVEFWLTKRFSLAGEYRLTATYDDGWSESRYNNYEPHRPSTRYDTTSWRVGVSSSALLLSIYF